MERDESVAAGEEINETNWHIYILHVTSWHSAFCRAVLSLSYYWNVVDISNKILAFLRAYFLKLNCNILLGEILMKVGESSSSNVLNVKRWMEVKQKRHILDFFHVSQEKQLFYVLE